MSNQIEKVKTYLQKQAPFKVILGKTEVFPPSLSSDGAAVVVVRVDAPELHRMYKELEAEAQWKPSDFSEYKPHLTVAYIKPESAEKYMNDDSLEGAEYEITELVISDANKNRHVVKLKGLDKTVTASPITNTLPYYFEDYCKKHGGFENLFRSIGTYDWDAYMESEDSNLSPEDAESVMKSRAFEEWEERYNEIMWQHEKWSWPLTVWRTVTLKNIKELKTKGVGIYWSYDMRAADAHWGGL